MGTSRIQIALERLATRAALSVLSLLWIPYLLSRALGIDSGAPAGLAVALLLSAALIVPPLSPLSCIRPPRASYLATAVLAGLLFFAAILLFRTNLREAEGGLNSSGVGCEDMGMHASLANAFLHSSAQVLHPTYPIYPGWPLGYPFLSDFSAAATMAAGLPIGWAFFLPALIAFFALVLCFGALASRYLHFPYVVLAFLLFLLGGNLGILFYLKDLLQMDLPQRWLEDYANNAGLDLHYGNIFTAVLMPMRTSLFGAPIALAVLLLLTAGKPPRHWEKLSCGLLVGSLPLIHAHSFLVVCMMTLVLSVRHPIAALRTWWTSLLVALPLAVPQVLWVRTQISESATPFIRLTNGFLSETTLGWISYWFLNGGIFLPLAFGAYFWARPSLQRITLPFLLLLPLSMFVTFQPYSFDNIKLLVFLNAACALLVADLSAQLQYYRRSIRVLRNIAVLLCLSTGLLSWVRELNVPCQMASPEERAVAELVLRTTDQSSVLLTGQKFNHPVPFLTGRTIVLGFHNWLDQHGIPFQERAEDVREIYDGGPHAIDLLRRYRVTHIIVGPYERAEFLELNEAALAALSKSIERTRDYAIYRIL